MPGLLLLGLVAPRLFDVDVCRDVLEAVLPGLEYVPVAARKQLEGARHLRVGFRKEARSFREEHRVEVGVEAEGAHDQGHEDGEGDCEVEDVRPGEVSRGDEPPGALGQASPSILMSERVEHPLRPSLPCPRSQLSAQNSTQPPLGKVAQHGRPSQHTLTGEIYAFANPRNSQLESSQKCGFMSDNKLFVWFADKKLNLSFAKAANLR